MGYYIEGRLAITNGEHQKGYEIYKNGIDCGDIRADFGLAEMYWRGWYVPQSCDTAREIIDRIYKKLYKMAKHGDSEAQTIMYVIHVRGYITKGADLSFGIEMLKKATGAEDNPIAHLFMALECIKSNAFFLGEKYYEKAASYPGATGIKVVLTDNYARGVNGFSINQEKSFKWCRLAAEEGSSLAQFGLCGKYIRGEGVAKSMDEAVKWCKLSADNGNAEASKYLCELIYSRDIEQGRLNDEDSLENMIKLYESGFTQCSVSLQLSLLQNAREKAKSEVQEALLKSIEYFKQLFDMNGSYITLYSKELADVFYKVALIFESDDNYVKAVEYYNEAFKHGLEKAMYNLATIYYDGKNGVADYSNALYFFKKCTIKGIEEGRAHYYIGSCFYWGLGVPVDYENAKKHFIQAYEYGFNCNSAISLVESELNDGENINSMRSYAESLKKKQLSEEERYARIIKDLQSDFGDAWNKTQADTKKFIATGIDIYISQYFKGPHIFGNYDFSASINEMCKALENELRVHLYSNYIAWLQSRGISPNEFLEANNLSSHNVKRSILRRVNSTEFAYEDASKTDKFTLGSVHLTVGKDKGQATIDKTMLDYLDYIFGTHTFDENIRTEEINKYIVSLVDDLWTISELYRNPAAHSRKMDCKKAEACGDYIIKVKKLLIHFLEKIEF